MGASCCSLLNEVMDKGAVGGLPKFGAGVRPFRFTPSAGSTYPPTNSGRPTLVCKACGQAFSVLKRQKGRSPSRDVEQMRSMHICCDCRNRFCSVCSLRQRRERLCATCHLLQGTAFQRPQLLRLRVRDLRQYLVLRSIPTDTCRKKEDLVDLVRFHRGGEEEEEGELGGGAGDGHSTSLMFQFLYTAPPPSAQSVSELSTISQEEPLSSSPSSGNNQDTGDMQSDSQPNLDISENTPKVSPQTRRGTWASLTDLSGPNDIEGLKVRQLKEILARNFVNYSGCCEKWELVERVNRLYRETERDLMSLGNVNNALTADGQRPQLDQNLCRICMDAVIDCVLLECGHMVTCTKCGKRMNECPICRQYVVRAVHVFRS